MIKAPDSNQTREFYDNLSSGRVSRGIWGKGARFNAGRIASKPSVQKFFVEAARPYVGVDCTVLDVGCGPGGFLRALAPHCRRITGVDLTRSFVEECRAMIDRERITNAGVLQASAMALPYADASFDRVLMVDTIHHLYDVVAGLREVYRVLRPGGTLIVFEPNKGNPLLALMCLQDRNEWGLLPLGTKRAYRRLFARGYRERACEYNGLLVGPDSKLSLWLADLLSSPGWHRVVGWLCPKIFMAFQKT